MRRNTRNLEPFIGKTISGIVETSLDEDMGRVLIQFTDGSSVEFRAESSSGTPWLNVDPVSMVSELKQITRDGQAFALKTSQLTGLEQGPRPVPAVDDDYIGGPTEAGNPVDDEIFEPVDEEVMDLQDYDDETLKKMGR